MNTNTAFPDALERLAKAIEQLGRAPIPEPLRPAAGDVARTARDLAAAVKAYAEK